jgi:hypothetical protein
MGTAALVAVVMFTFLGGAVVRWLWNWLLPPLFGWPAITFWQALAMLALCRILFGGLGLHGNAGSRMRRRIAERWDAMTHEEREHMRDVIRERWGFGPSPGESKPTL